MSRRLFPTGMYVQVLIALGIVVVATMSGFWLGSLGGPKVYPGVGPAVEGTAPEAGAQNGEAEAVYTPPLFLSVNTMPGADLGAITEEVKMAAGVGIDRLVVLAPLPWGEDETIEPAMETLDVLAEANPKARLILWLDLEPSESWLAAHPDAVATAEAVSEPGAAKGEESEAAGDAGKDGAEKDAQKGETDSPEDTEAEAGEGSAASKTRVLSLASETWDSAAELRLTALVKAIAVSGHKERVEGYVLGCLESGAWHRTGPYDRSEGNVAGFRQWLRERYQEDGALQAAWGAEGVTLADAAIPEEPAAEEPMPVFFDVAKERAQIDYIEYVSDLTARVIARLVLHVKNTAETPASVWIPYGYSFELTSNRSGHGALAELLDSEVDGFVSPVSNTDRGLGGAGGFMGPVDSAALHGKQWFIVDDTRTGIARNPVSGEVEHITGLYPEDVYNVLYRNFSAALAHGLGLFWADAAGDGRFLDNDMWQRFDRMAKAYRTIAESMGNPGSRAVDLEEKTELVVVVDEDSRSYQRCDVKLNELVLTGGRDSALRSGVPTRFCLLSDVIEGRGAPAVAYLFLNAFYLAEEDRLRLHERLGREQAAAIWLYAPGYIGVNGAAAGNIAATVGMPVAAFEGGGQAGSVYGFAGDWMAKDEALGSAEKWDPLFYVDSTDTNILATYSESEKPSITMQFIEQGWTSVYIAEPALTPALLREILRLLEIRPRFLPGTPLAFDVAHFSPALLAFHASVDGERSIDLQGVFNVQDLLEPEVGWPQKSGLDVATRTGQTRLFQLSRVDELED